jgi:V/A-type H+-transporting ATPase subunit I
MTKVQLIGPRTHFIEALSLLHELGSLHIEDLSKRVEAGSVPLDKMDIIDEQVAEKELLAELLVRLRAVIKALSRPEADQDLRGREEQYKAVYSLSGDELSDTVSQILNQVEERVAALSRQENSLESDLALFRRYQPVLAKIQPLAKEIVTTGSYDSVALLFDRRYKGALEALKSELDTITRSQCEIVSADVDEETTAAVVVYAKRYADAVHSYLAVENVNQIRLPSEFQDMPFEEAYDQLGVREREIPHELDEVRGELADIATLWYTRLTATRDALIDKQDEFDTIPKVGRTEYTFVVTGWLPVNQLKSLAAAIKERFGDEIIIDKLQLDEGEYSDTPVALSNPKFVQPFQKLLGMVGGPPKYGTFDPTMLLAIFYPIMFGLIVGDIAYGIIMLIIVLYLRRKYAGNQGIQIGTSIFLPAAVMAIPFGFMFAEFFGAEIDFGFTIPIPFTDLVLPFHRTNPDYVGAYMVFVLGIGFIHLSLGFVLGILNAVRTRHLKHAFSKAGLLSVLMGLLFVAMGFALTAVQPLMQAIAAIAILGGVFVTLKFAGPVMGFIEVLEIVSNVASYIRLMAVGLAGAIFAVAANELAVDAGWVLGGLIGLVMHSLNIVIAVISPNIHALRLNLLEFFNKFYEPGSEEYRPFRKTRGEKSA